MLKNVMRGNDRRMRGVAFAMAAGWIVAASSVLRAQYLPIYGGPTFNSATGSGNDVQGLVFPGTSAASGAGFGNVGGYLSKDSRSDRAIRWGPAGIMELQSLTPIGLGSTSSANGVSPNGLFVAGQSTGDTIHAVRWDASSGTVTKLENIDANPTDSWAVAVNDSGTAVGYALNIEPGSGAYRGTIALRWDGTGTAATQLGNLGVAANGAIESQAWVVNSSGMAAGFSHKYEQGSDKGRRAVRWDPSGTAATELTPLGTDSSGSTTMEAFAINDAGAVLGYAYKFVNDEYKGNRAVRWDLSGAAIELGNLGMDNSENTSTQAYAINNSNLIAGVALKFVAGIGQGWRPVRWNASGAPTELGLLGTDFLNPPSLRSINDAGIIVGSMDSRAVMWGMDGVAIDLNTFVAPGSGWVSLSQAYDISNDNWITGIGRFDPDGGGPLKAYNRLFLIQVPEPSPIALLAFALSLKRLRRFSRDRDRVL